MGALLEVTLIQRMYYRPLDTLLVTFGVGLILQQVARDIFGAPAVNMVAPAWLSGVVWNSSARSAPKKPHVHPAPGGRLRRGAGHRVEGQPDGTAQPGGRAEPRPGPNQRHLVPQDRYHNVFHRVGGWPAWWVWR